MVRNVSCVRTFLKVEGHSKRQMQSRAQRNKARGDEMKDRTRRKTNEQTGDPKNVPTYKENDSKDSENEYDYSEELTSSQPTNEQHPKCVLHLKNRNRKAENRETATDHEEHTNTPRKDIIKIRVPHKSPSQAQMEELNSSPNNTETKELQRDKRHHRKITDSLEKTSSIQPQEEKESPHSEPFVDEKSISDREQQENESSKYNSPSSPLKKQSSMYSHQNVAIPPDANPNLPFSPLPPEKYTASQALLWAIGSKNYFA